MSTSILRHCARSIPAWSRHVSTAAPSAASQQQPSSQDSSPQKSLPEHYPPTTLPREKMRALIALYHEAESFITQDTLSQAIDRAFLDRPTRRQDREMNYNDLLKLRLRRKWEPKMSAVTAAPSAAKSAEEMEKLKITFSSQVGSEKEQRVWDALYGTERVRKPGLEAVEDEYERIVERIKYDQEQQSQ